MHHRKLAFPGLSLLSQCQCSPLLGATATIYRSMDAPMQKRGEISESSKEIWRIVTRRKKEADGGVSLSVFLQCIVYPDGSSIGGPSSQVAT